MNNKFPFQAFKPFSITMSNGKDMMRRKVPALNKFAKQPHYYGHRERLRDRFIRVGKEGLSDYELLELIIFRAVPKGDVKPLAKEILLHFDGKFNRAISASPTELLRIEGVTPELVNEFKIVEGVAHRLSQSEVEGKNAISSWDELMHYCKVVMAHRDTEQFRILFLDQKNFLIADEAQARGTVDHVPVYPREVLKRAIELNASALILIHNHPSGDPSPSNADRQVTKQIIEACATVGVEVYDHVVIGKAQDFSFRGNGLL